MSNVGLLTFLRRATFMTLLGCFFLCSSWAQEASPAVGNPAPRESKVAPSQSEKSPGEQLLDFMMNPPEVYDVGGMCVMYWTAKPGTNHFRIKKDNQNLLSAIGEAPIVSENPIGNLKHYGLVWSRYGDEYWNLNDIRGLTTWTNRHLAEEENNFFVGLEKDNAYTAKKLISFYFQSIQSTPIIENKNLILYKDSKGEIISTRTLTYDTQGYLVQLVDMAKTAQQIYITKNKYLLGIIIYYHYGTNNVPSFFPSSIDHFFINKTVTNGVEQIQTNLHIHYSYDYLNLSPSFNRSDFAIEPPAEEEKNFTRYWISGTNRVYMDHESGTIQRVLSHEDVQMLRSNQQKKQSQYRQLYISLAIVLGIGIVYLILRKKNRNG